MEKMTYKDWKKFDQEAYNNSWIIFAFTKEQLEKNEDYIKAKRDWKKFVSLFGGIITTENFDKLQKKLEENHKKFCELVDNDDDFLYEAMRYELGNHEFCYDMDFDVFNYLWIMRTERTEKIYSKAKSDYLNNCDY